MGAMKELLIEKEEAMVNEAVKESGISKEAIWDCYETFQTLNANDLEALELVEDICKVAKHGEDAIIEYYEAIANAFVDRRECIIRTTDEDYFYSSNDDMLCDIMYTVVEIERSTKYDS